MKHETEVLPHLKNNWEKKTLSTMVYHSVKLMLQYSVEHSKCIQVCFLSAMFVKIKKKTKLVF